MGTFNDGYRMVMAHHHPFTWANGYIKRATLVVEAIIGKLLPQNAVVHHVDGKKENDRPGNLVVCQDTAYHTFLHHRQKALDECGHANWRRCWLCKTWDDPKNLRIYPGTVHHFSCYTNYRRRKA